MFLRYKSGTDPNVDAIDQATGEVIESLFEPQQNAWNGVVVFSGMRDNRSMLQIIDHFDNEFFQDCIPGKWMCVVLNREWQKMVCARVSEVKEGKGKSNKKLQKTNKTIKTTSPNTVMYINFIYI